MSNRSRLRVKAIALTIILRLRLFIEVEQHPFMSLGRTTFTVPPVRLHNRFRFCVSHNFSPVVVVVLSDDPQTRADRRV